MKNTDLAVNQRKVFSLVQQPGYIILEKNHLRYTKKTFNHDNKNKGIHTQKRVHKHKVINNI